MHNIKSVGVVCGLHNYNEYLGQEILHKALTYGICIPAMLNVYRSMDASSLVLTCIGFLDPSPLSSNSVGSSNSSTRRTGARLRYSKQMRQVILAMLYENSAEGYAHIENTFVTFKLCQR